MSCWSLNQKIIALFVILLFKEVRELRSCLKRTVVDQAVPKQLRRWEMWKTRSRDVGKCGRQVVEALESWTELVKKTKSEHMRTSFPLFRSNVPSRVPFYWRPSGLAKAPTDIRFVIQYDKIVLRYEISNLQPPERL
jgi:hypothetical protein